MYKKSDPVTRLCTSDVDNIWIRGRNLCDALIGKVTFTDFIVFHFFGVEPTPLQRAVVDAVLVCIMEHGMTPSAVASRVTYLGAPESLQVRSLRGCSARARVSSAPPTRLRSS